MSRILLLHATTHGHTARIASRIARAARSAGVHVDVREVEDAGEIDPAHYEGVIVGASVHLGSHQGELVRWASERRQALESRPSAFFSVSLAAADDSAEAREAVQGYLDGFVEATGWRPDERIAFAGALEYREYDAFTRTLMRLLMGAAGEPADSDRDYDFTDWDAVERFAREFAGRVAAAA